MAHNPNHDHDQNEARRRYIEETFGSDALEGLESFNPTITRSAKTHAKEPLQAAARREQAEDLELVQQVATDEDEDQALAHVLRVMRRGGGRVPPGYMAKAGRAAARRGYTHGTTAERLARMAGS